MSFDMSIHQGSVSGMGSPSNASVERQEPGRASLPKNPVTTERGNAEKVGRAILGALAAVIVGAVGTALAAASFFAWTECMIIGAVIFSASLCLESAEGMMAGGAIFGGPVGFGVATLAAMAGTFGLIYNK